ETGDELAGDRRDGRDRVPAEALDVRRDVGVLPVQAAVGAAQVPGLGDRAGDDDDGGVAQVAEPRRVVGGGVHGAERGDDLELVTLRLPHDQGVQAVLRCQRPGGVRTAPGEGGDAPAVAG